MTPGFLNLRNYEMMLNLGVTCHIIDVLPIINLSWHQHLCSCSFIHLTNIWVLRMWQRLVFLPYNQMSLNFDKFISKWSCSVVSDSLQPHGLQPIRLLHPWNFPGKSTGVGCHFLPGNLPDPGIEPGSPALWADTFTFWATREVFLKSASQIWDFSNRLSLSHQCPNSGPHNSHQNYITTDSQLVSLILLCPSQVWSLDNTDKQHMRKRWGRTRKKFSQGIKDPIIFVDKWLKLDSPGSLSERESSLPTQCVYRKRRGYSCGQFRDSKMTQCSHTEWSENTGFHNVDKGSIPGSGRPPGEGNGKPLWYSCPENLMDRGTWQATVHGVAESDTT